MGARRIIFFYSAVVCLGLGSIIYILFRPTSLLMFHWANLLGLMEPIEIMRLWAGNGKNLAPWFVYSLPFALWVSAYLFFIKVVWWKPTSWVRHMWFWIVPLIAVNSEFCQYFHIIPGTFDILDILTVGVGTALVFAMLVFNQLNTGEKVS